MDKYAKIVKQLEEKVKIIRRYVIEMIYAAGSGHPGGSLSAVDILTTLYFHVMRHIPKNPRWGDRDRFVLSKGHAAPALYAVLGEAGYFPVGELRRLRKLGSPLQGHPCMKKVPGVDMSTGSLGQGLSVANGMALGGKLDRKGYEVYVMIGDGECDCGQIWESAMTSAHYKLDNLCGIVDVNGLQIDGFTKDVMNIEPLPDKWKAFGWNVIKVDGHSIEAMVKAFGEAEKVKGKPTVILADTVKGRGVDFMEHKAEWHGKAPKDDEKNIAVKCLGECK